MMTTKNTMGLLAKGYYARVFTENTEISKFAEEKPKFTILGEKRQWIIEEMAAAFRIFARKG